MVILDFGEIAKLQYHHVKVVTTVRRAHEFESEFSPRLIGNQNNQDQMLIYTGYLKAIDPITKSTILCSIEGELVKNNILVLGHIIGQIQLSKVNETLPVLKVQRIVEADSLSKVSYHPYFLQERAKNSLTIEELNLRRNEILVWLRKNRIPADLNSSTNEILIADSVRLKVPYEHVSDYICPTRVVLKRIKQIIDSRHDFVT